MPSNGDVNGSCDDGSLESCSSPNSSQQPPDSQNSNDSSRFADIQKVPAESGPPVAEGEAMDGSEGDGEGDENIDGEEDGDEDDGNIDEDEGESEGDEEIQGDDGDEHTGDTERSVNQIPEASIADSVELANGTEDDDEPEEGEDGEDDAISINSGKIQPRAEIEFILLKFWSILSKLFSTGKEFCLFKMQIIVNRMNQPSPYYALIFNFRFSCKFHFLSKLFSIVFLMPAKFVFHVFWPSNFSFNRFSIEFSMQVLQVQKMEYELSDMVVYSLQLTEQKRNCYYARCRL